MGRYFARGKPAAERNIEELESSNRVGIEYWDNGPPYHLGIMSTFVADRTDEPGITDSQLGDSAQDEEQERRHDFWRDFRIACKRGFRAGRKTPKLMVDVGKFVLTPFYSVAARIIVTIDNISRESVRRGNLVVGAGRDQYGDDGENLLVVNMDGES